MSSTATSGRWPVILSGRVIRELRHLGRDQHTLDIVRKKFQELSFGQFTIDNYLAIRGTAENVPIYRARMSNDLRIIYQIDLVADPDAQHDHQVIKVFSVSSRARVSYDFWVKVSKYLVRLGAEYQKRCTARSAVNNSAISTYTPQAFPHQQYSNVFVDNNYVFEGEVDLTELHETLVLEKFTPITKSLYNSILADMEAVLPMALNPDERRIVRHQGTSVVIGRSGTGKTTALIYKLRANAQASAMLDNEPPIRQLFVTRSRVLTQHIARNYRGLLESSDIAHKTREELAEIRRDNENNRKRELVEFDNEVDLRDDLPERFSLLADSHFPLFISFDKLCSLLEADIQSLQEGGSTKCSMVNFTDFKYDYWPKFDYALTRNLDPGLVFSEILGVIKGYGEILSRDDYVSNLSHRKSPLLLHARDRVYAIFEAYSKRARIRNQIDAADRTRAILKAHDSNPLSGASQVDYIFVDEVQDQLILDVHLLQSLCSNPDGGYWCGDTAQTISIGSSFRIKDLKAFIYQDMLSYRGSGSGRKAPAPFTTFELSVNFRSHGGIVRYAASLVELIYTLFPNSIDHMEPETARTPGPVPLLFISPNDDESTFVRYLLGSRSSDGTPFGAHQAIIVRSESTASSLTQRLQKRCTVLTLLETKGLEFDDLIIYNFFSESEAPVSSWRALLALTGEIRDGRIYYDKQTAPPTTSPTLCAELKQLYVAVTRARHRCWLWDSGEVINLTKTFWLKFELVEVADALERVAGFAVSSKDLQEWTQRGQEFFSSGLYALAKSCFERAGQGKEATIADAYYHMSEAKKSQDKRDHLKAAKMMESCARLAGEGHSNNVLWYHAATCFEAAREIPSASRSYRNGKFYDRAASVSFEYQNFDDALLTLLPHSDKMELPIFEKIRDVARMHYLRTSNYDKLRKLFDNDQEACIEYARLSGFSAQLKDLLKESSRFEDLANVHLTEGSPAEATQYLLKSSTHPSSVSRVGKIASDYLWLNLSLDSTPDQRIRRQASQLFEILSPLEERLGRSMTFDLNLFKASLGQATISLDLLDSADLQQQESKHRLVLGYHHALQSSAWTLGNIPGIVGVLRYLSGWRTYADNIYSIIELPNPSHLSRVQQLLGCSAPTKKPRTGTFVHVASSSLIYERAKDQAHIRIDRKTSRGENLIAGADTDRLIRHELSERLERRLLALHSELLGSRWVNPPTISLKHSRRSRRAAPSVPSIEDQMPIISMAATLLHPIRVRSAEQLSGNSNKTVRHAWITRLFGLVNPPTGMICNAFTLSELLTDRAPERCIQGWINEYIWSLKSSRKCPELFLSMFVMGLSLSHELGTQYLRPLIGYGHSAELRAIAYDLSCLFGHENRPRVAKCICALGYIVHHKLKIDIAILVHLVERITREAILAERMVVSSQRLNGVSGLIMPLSWVRSLISYPRLSPQMFDAGLIYDLALCIGGVIRRIKDGVPAHWKTPSTEPWRHSVSSLSIRLYWCLALIIVNIHPNHRALQAILGTLQRGIENPGDRFECEALHDGSEESKIETITAGYDQQSCLLVLSQTLQHEELVLLAQSGAPYCPAKQRFVSRTIAFDNLLDLGQKLFGRAATTEPIPDSRAEDDGSAPRDVAPVDPAQSHEEHTSPALGPVEPEPTDGPNQAAKHIQQWWRRHRERQYLLESSELSQEAQYYRRLSPLISKHIVGTSKREKLFRKVLRGPGILVILSVEMLSEQLDESLYTTRLALQASNIDAKVIEALQKRLKAIGGFHKIVDTLRKALSADSPPEALKASNLSMIKTRFTQNAKALFGDVKKSKVLQDTEALAAAEELLSRGTNAVKKARAA
ncbi:hypothetical protein FS749_001367 [Ceratobasidium sp. UAMH 11750]|nr:hypothetical protein FS749_001367 [Ceratobasidium sp. UAMH 11750]